MALVIRMLDRLRTAAQVGELAGLCRRHDVELLVLFGSAATQRPEGHGPRDLDLAVAFRPGTDADLLGFIDDLADLVGGDRLDVMDLAAAEPVAAHRALTTGELLHEATPHTFAERQIFAVNHYIETAPLRRAIHESLAR